MELNAVFTYIEMHLNEDLTLDVLARHFGYSKYYFLRSFHRETDTTPSDYIRRRRLASAASLLRHTDYPILRIAFELCFESQEAFTRSFKKIYGLPPGKYRLLMKDLTKGYKIMSETNPFKAWTLTGSAPEKYQLMPDDRIFNAGTQSARLNSVTEKINTGDFCAIAQLFSARYYIGKRVRLSGYLKTLSVDGYAGLWLRIDTPSGTAAFDNMHNRPVNDTSSWCRYTCVLDVPLESTSIAIGALLCGIGTLWIDQLQFEVVDLSVPLTVPDQTEHLPGQPANLDFQKG